MQLSPLSRKDVGRLFFCYTPPVRVSLLFSGVAAVLLVSCASSGDTLSVSQVLIGSEINDRQEVVVFKDRFLPSDRTFHAHVFVEGLTKTAEITGAWWYVPQDRKIFETVVSVTPEFPVAKFVLSNNAQDWAVGEYLFIAHHEDQELFSKEILVSGRG